jgi:uncharacterized membrane protein
MAATKVGSTLVASVASTAGSALNAQAGSKDLTTAYGAVITAKVTNGATGPTIACVVEIDYSVDGTTWKIAQQVTASLGNSVVATFVFEIPVKVMWVRIGFGGNTGQAVTVEAQIHVVTAI